MKINKLVIILLVIAVFGVCTVTYGKYVSNTAKDYYLKSKGFYFTSDHLSMSGTQNVNNVWDGTSIHFNVKNNLNQNVITNYDISYDALCEIEGEANQYVACYINGTNENTQSGVLSSSETCSNSTSDGIDVSQFDKTNCELNGYDWLSQISIGELYFDVVKTDQNYSLKNVTVNVTVTSTSPYEKVLKGKFILSKTSSIDDEINLNYQNYNNYDKLIISNSYNVQKCMTISWDANKTRIENNNLSSYQTDDNDYINQITVDIGPKSIVDYTFYPIEPSSNEDFTLTEISCQ